MTKTLLIAGGKGQVGQCFQALAHQFPQWQVDITDRSSLDIADARSVAQYFKLRQGKLFACVNAAAYTAVDKAESEPDLARRINAVGARHLATACAAEGIPLVHLSTDYVYHSHQNTPFKEGDRESPKGVYAKTKLAGDRAVLKACPIGGMVLRTSWVYSPYGHNFMKTMLRLGAERPALNVVFDQIGTPTYAPDLAEAVLQILTQFDRGERTLADLSGVWHYSNEGVCSWYDFAVAIMELAGLPCQVSPIPSSQYPTPAQRPPFSVLDKAKIKNAFGIAIPYWREGVRRGVLDLRF